MWWTRAVMMVAFCNWINAEIRTTNRYTHTTTRAGRTTMTAYAAQPQPNPTPRRKRKLLSVYLRFPLSSARTLPRPCSPIPTHGFTFWLKRYLSRPYLQFDLLRDLCLSQRIPLCHILFSTFGPAWFWSTLHFVVCFFMYVCVRG